MEEKWRTGMVLDGKRKGEEDETKAQKNRTQIEVWRHLPR